MASYSLRRSEVPDQSISANFSIFRLDNFGLWVYHFYDKIITIKPKQKMDENLHPLEKEYGLTKEELLDAINRRFRARVTLGGAVAEVHLGKQIKALY